MRGPRNTPSPAAGAFDTTTPAVVLKLDSNPLHHGGLGVIRGLGRLGVPVYGVCEDPLAPAAHSRYLHGRWQWRAGAGTEPDIVDGLARIAERLGGPTVVLPTDDAGAILLAERAAELHPWLLFPRPPADLPRKLAGKDSLHRLCRAHGVPGPVTETVTTWPRARAFAASAGYPLVAKLAAPWLRRGSRVASTSLVHTPNQLAELHRAAGQPIVLQEFLPRAAEEPGRGQDWFLHGYLADEPARSPVCTGVKERSYPSSAGLTSFGRWVVNDEIERSAIELLRSTGFRGIVDMDWRWDPRDDRYKLLDCNPRLGAQFRLFSDWAGIDLAVAAYLELTGQRVPNIARCPERRFVVENYDPLAAFDGWRSGRLGVREWVDSLRGAEEPAWFARDDLAPFGLMCLRMGWRALSRRIPLPRRARRARPPEFHTGRAGNRQETSARPPNRTNRVPS
ncbi:Predicted ATP-dependent carboligase, ATP-grasp superfamily [Actinopolyspora xinjiangensis]|uniref:Predicted ATP-dependent carboligase, ATP-grasp superfamily n=1 Tax=Actinopolyspora xinjiangensis TaxID=405564 RepID=A0A1H0WUU2_9ACTN|nr:carboxylate--amine ligase [Actinopolyspora xinjiangensis]SDP94452.1 Predicted ATP-dependent carboligase, ATP-grasp superfamily [Actinopolyspora xinjiangensis]